MGSRSKSSSSNTSGQTQSTMNQLAGGKVSNSSMMDLLSKLQGGQMGQMLPIFDALMQNGNSRFDSHPMMGFFGGGQQQAPRQSLSEIFQSMQPQQPPQQPPPPQAPWMQGMTPEQMAAIQRFNGYGGRR
jgi:hypothetical protein